MLFYKIEQNIKYIYIYIYKLLLFCNITRVLFVELNRQSNLTQNCGIVKIVELITTTFYNLKFHVLQSSSKCCYILKNMLLTSKLYSDKIAYILLEC